MILYTMMPHELVFQNQSQEFEGQKMITFEGIPVIVEMGEDHKYRVVRVISSDPSHYLDARCEPGASISFS